MIRNHFKRLLAEREFSESRVISIKEVSEVTGIHRNTLTKFANERGYNAGLDIVDKLCSYFSCSVDALIEHVPDTKS